MKSLFTVMIAFGALLATDAVAQTAAQRPAAKSSSYGKSAFSTGGNSFTRERGQNKPVAGTPAESFYGQQYGDQSGGATTNIPSSQRSPVVESSDR